MPKCTGRNVVRTGISKTFWVSTPKQFGYISMVWLLIYIYIYFLNDGKVTNMLNLLTHGVDFFNLIIFWFIFLFNFLEGGWLVWLLWFQMLKKATYNFWYSMELRMTFHDSRILGIIVKWNLHWRLPLSFVATTGLTVQDAVSMEKKNCKRFWCIKS